jgi:hypothetical protein
MYEKHPLNAKSFFVAQQIGSLPNNDECSESHDECSYDKLNKTDMQDANSDERENDSDQESESDFSLNSIGNSERETTTTYEGAGCLLGSFVSYRQYEQVLLQDP